jgi:hypothetical protein
MPTPTALTVVQDVSFWSQLWKTLDLWLVNFAGRNTGLLLTIVLFIVFVRPMITAFIKSYWTKEARPAWANALLATFGVLHMFYRWAWGLTLAKLGLAMPPEDEEKSGVLNLGEVPPSATAAAVKRQEAP